MMVVNNVCMCCLFQWSDALSVTTLAVAPGQCQSPKLQGKPKATSLHLRWSKYIVDSLYIPLQQKLTVNSL